jgi:hypothetical protein
VDLIDQVLERMPKERVWVLMVDIQLILDFLTAEEYIFITG